MKLMTLIIMRSPVDLLMQLTRVMVLYGAFKAVEAADEAALFKACAAFLVESLILFIYNGTVWRAFGKQVIILYRNRHRSFNKESLTQKLQMWIYWQRALRQLNALIELKSLGFSLDEIKELMSGGITGESLVNSLVEKKRLWEESIQNADNKMKAIRNERADSYTIEA